MKDPRKPDKLALGRRFAEVRESLGLTRQRVELKCGIPNGVVGKLERGLKLVSYERFFLLLKTGFELSPEDKPFEELQQLFNKVLAFGHDDGERREHRWTADVFRLFEHAFSLAGTPGIAPRDRFIYGMFLVKMLERLVHGDNLIRDFLPSAMGFLDDIEGLPVDEMETVFNTAALFALCSTKPGDTKRDKNTRARLLRARDKVVEVVEHALEGFNAGEIPGLSRRAPRKPPPPRP